VAATLLQPLDGVTLRVEVDDRSESVGRRIRDGQLQKVPYLLVVGDREVEAGAVSVRERGQELGSMPLAALAARIAAEVAGRRLPGDD
jgi:threonyl-tRNA synthetase